MRGASLCFAAAADAPRAACQPFTQPGGVMSRATLLGRVEQLAGDALAEAQERFAAAHNGRTGVDAVLPGDVYFRLAVERVFFVGGLGSVRLHAGRVAYATPTDACPPVRRTRALRWSPATRTARRRRTRCGAWRPCWCGR